MATVASLSPLDRIDRAKATLAVLALGFFFTALEVRVLHLGAVREHWTANLPTICSWVGVAASVAALAKGAGVRWAATIAFAGIALIGMVGFQQHTELKVNALRPLFATAGSPTAEREEDEEEGERAPWSKEAEQTEEEAPPLAPLSLVGLGMIGALMAAPSRKN